MVNLKSVFGLDQTPNLCYVLTTKIDHKHTYRNKLNYSGLTNIKRNVVTVKFYFMFWPDINKFGYSIQWSLLTILISNE